MNAISTMISATAASLLLVSTAAFGQTVWDDNLGAPQQCDVNVPSTTTTYSFEQPFASSEEEDLSVIADNLETAIRNYSSLSWVTGINVSRVSEANVAITLSMTVNATGSPRSIVFGSSTYTTTYKITQDAAQPPTPPTPPVDPKPSDSTSVSWNRNWIMTQTFDGHLSSKDVDYYDGLCRQTQKSEINGKGDCQGDITTITSYDAFFRETVHFLPYARANSMGSYDSAANAAQTAWYSSRFGAEEAAHASSDDIYETAPEGRLLRSFLPGTVLEAHPSEHTYFSDSTSQVIRLGIDEAAGSLVREGYYAANTLSAEKVVDGDGSISVEWKDKDGKTVCTENGTGPSNAVTMYAYDRSGSLRWVVTPEGTSRIGNEASTIGTTSDFASKYCYVYVRDSRDRVVEKRIPGAEATYQVYDLAGRLMMSQDGNQRSGGKWSVFSYDESGRILEERLIAPANCPPRAALQAAFYSGNTPSTYYAAGTTLRECTYDTYPSSMDSSLSFVAVPGVVADSTRISDISSMLSYERVNVLGTETYATRAFYYDKHGHVVQTVEKRPDGEILRTSLLFDLRGNVLASQSHFTIASLNINDILASTFTYDSRGRKLTETSTLNGNVAIANVAYSYDDLGRLSVRSYNSEAEYPLEEDLSYNMQGWLNGQDDHTSDVNVFSSTLRYYDSFNGSVPRYGGDISSCSWIQYVQGGTRTYAFSYDPLSRLSGADQYGGSSLENRFTERGISYDRNGNITAITRHNNSASGTAKTFSYSGNRRVSNSYDANGNVTYDSESGVIASYNLINLPSSLITGDYNIYYDYLADGTKLRTQQEELWTGYTYAGPFRYNDNDGSLSLESVAFGEGRFVRTGTGARNFATRYFIKDHLGSVRVVADDNGTALERDDYLPYGERANDPALTRNGNNFLYGGKELQDRDDIDWYDSGARFQTTSGIFTSIDPEAEKYYPISPYAYCGGNPVNHIDPNGMTDWKLLRKGVETIISGAGTALVGIGLTGLTDGTAAPAGGVLLIVEGVSSVGIGAAMSIDGVVSNPSEQTKEVAENLPTSPSNALAKSADKVVGNKNHEVERTVDAAWTAVGIATLKMPTNFKEHIEFFGTMVQVKSTMSNVNQNSQQNKKSTSNNPDKSQNNNKKVKSYDTKKDNH